MDLSSLTNSLVRIAMDLCGAAAGRILIRQVTTPPFPQKQVTAPPPPLSLRSTIPERGRGRILTRQLMSPPSRSGSSASRLHCTVPEGGRGCG